MAQSGQFLRHPITGESLTFLKTSTDTGGKYMLMDFAMRPHSSIAGAHLHPFQSEKFEILAGSPSFRIRGRKLTLHAGEHITVPAGTPHFWWNEAETEARLRVTFCPALDMEGFFEMYFGLAQDGKVGRRTGLPNPLQMSLFEERFWDEARPPFPNWLNAIAYAILKVIARFGRLAGYRPYYSQYHA